MAGYLDKGLESFFFYVQPAIQYKLEVWDLKDMDMDMDVSGHQPLGSGV